MINQEPIHCKDVHYQTDLRLNKWYGIHGDVLSPLFLVLYIWAFRKCKHQRSLAPIWNDLWWLWWPMIFGDRWGLSFPDICLTVEENPRKTSTRKTDLTRDQTQARKEWGNNVVPRPDPVFLNNKLTAELYRKHLEITLLPYLDDLPLEKDKDFSFRRMEHHHILE